MKLQIACCHTIAQAFAVVLVLNAENAWRYNVNSGQWLPFIPHLVLQALSQGIDRAHECLVVFSSPRGLLTLFWAVIISGPSHANKLLAGYVAMRALGLEANFYDILLLQTLISFLLYFAPTPGASGLAELLSAAIMSIYVPRVLTPSYTLVWRFINSYATVITGAALFWYWLRRGLISREEGVTVGMHSAT